MTFEEAIEIIEKVDGEFGAFRYIINKLQETYAPKIKMTKAQFNWFTVAVNLYSELEDILGYRWETPTVDEDGYNDEVREIRLLEDKTLALAWLLPELIEVTDD